MIPREGSIKFDLRLSPAPPLPCETWGEINAWRRILYLTRLIGQDDDRYEGFAYGNISGRIAPSGTPDGRQAFVITGAQTGGLPVLSGEHYVTVTACFPEENRVHAEGPIAPSSEAMTHAAVYAADDSVRCVVHAHSRELWVQAERLGMPVTDPGTPYGSPEMACEVFRLFRGRRVADLQIFAMGGHEDGIVAFGRTVEEAATVVLTNLARALRRAHHGCVV